MNSDDVVAELESSQLALFESLSGTRRRVLEAKIRVAQVKRNADVQAQVATISQEYAAKGAYGSGARLSACWNSAAESERSFTDRLIADCLDVGVSEPLLARYAKAEARHYLHAFASSPLDR